MMAVKETTRDVLSLAAVCFLPETRVWGPGPEKQPFTGAWSLLSSTTRGGCGYVYGGTASGQTDQRMYASGYGRFNSPDRYKASGGPNNPGSWNKYSYVLGDPINLYDPTGRLGLTAEYCSQFPDDLDCSATCDDSRFDNGCDSGGGGSGGPGSSDNPPNCAVNGTSQLQISFILSHWGDADGTASKYSNNTSEVQTIAGAFILWSANETGTGTNAQLNAQNNYFGQQDPPNKAGWWGGLTVPCIKGQGGINSKTQNACFAPGTTWGAELNGILSSKSGKTGVTYGAALTNGLNNNPNEGAAAILQSLATNGYNPSGSYGTTVANGQITLSAGIDCLLHAGVIH